MRLNKHLEPLNKPYQIDTKSCDHVILAYDLSCGIKPQNCDDFGTFWISTNHFLVPIIPLIIYSKGTVLKGK